MQPVRPREKLLNLPNVLTLVRIGSIPILLGLLYLEGPFWAAVAAVVFFLAGLTDLLDGWLARRLKQVSLFGQYLDPVADKLLVASVLLVLVDKQLAPAWMAVIIICREIAVSGMRAVAASRGFQVPSDLWGKAKTALQMLALLLLILHYPRAGLDIRLWGEVALWAAVVITIISGVGYFKRFLHRLEKSQEAGG